MIKPFEGNKTAGFTLVEIMIVVVIVGILARVAVPQFIQARNRGRINACINNLRIISAAKDQAALDLNLNSTATPTTTQMNKYLRAYPLVNGLPKEPAGGTYTIGAISVNPRCSRGSPHTL